MCVQHDELLHLTDAAEVAPGLGPFGQGYRMEQKPVEWARFLGVCIEHCVCSMLELGTGEYGGTARFCTDIARWDVTRIDVREPLHRSGRFILGETGDEGVKDRRFDLVLIGTRRWPRRSSRSTTPLRGGKVARV